MKGLENVPDARKDWDSRSDRTVLNLVDPSLYPVVWGITKALDQGTVSLDRCGQRMGTGYVVGRRAGSFFGMGTPQTTGIGYIELVNRQPDMRADYWGSFQWLPSRVEFTPDGAAKIASYINNLHPVRHKELYDILDRIVSATIPLWEDSLGGFVDRRRIDLKDTGDHDFTYREGLLYQISGEQPVDPRLMPKLPPRPPPRHACEPGGYRKSQG